MFLLALCAARSRLSVRFARHNKRLLRLLPKSLFLVSPVQLHRDGLGKASAIPEFRFGTLKLGAPASSPAATAQGNSPARCRRSQGGWTTERTLRHPSSVVPSGLASAR